MLVAPRAGTDLPRRPRRARSWGRGLAAIPRPAPEWGPILSRRGLTAKLAPTDPGMARGRESSRRALDSRPVPSRPVRPRPTRNGNVGPEEPSMLNTRMLTLATGLTIALAAIARTSPAQPPD